MAIACGTKPPNTYAKPIPDQLIRAGGRSRRPRNKVVLNRIGRISGARSKRRIAVIAFRDQQCLCDNQRARRCDHEAGELGSVIGKQQVCCQHNQVEADKKGDRRRQDFAKFAQQNAPTRRTKPADVGSTQQNLRLPASHHDGEQLRLSSDLPCLPRRARGSARTARSRPSFRVRLARRSPRVCRVATRGCCG